ncbi:hypothetical protein MNBD_GAMMA12-3720 [hydrothermal vent metagenome]|uniref:peptidylprolyl isomerase n=1 Tax=hydrothermal vent metagenome TaxID=652676 RepID=A0A3B0YEV5_9ZZZZ
MNDGIKVTEGSAIVIHFTITLEDGTIAESSRDGDPYEFVIGDGSINPGLELALIGKLVGEQESIIIGPEIAFGYPEDDAIMILPKDDFPDDVPPEPGNVIMFTVPSGEELPGVVLEDLGEAIKIDFNHPLAGHDLNFDFEIIDIN